jgi:hypothetical protein
MEKGSLSILAVSAAMLSACGGTASNLPEDDVRYGFEAKLLVVTATPQPGRRVDFTLDLKSTGNIAVECDVIMRILAVSNGEEIYTQRWERVMFQPNSPWNLSNGFLPATDVETTYNVSIEVRRHATGDLLFSDADASQLIFAN